MAVTYHFSKPNPDDGDAFLTLNIEGVNNGPYPISGVPTDADLVDFGNAILATDFFQNLPWVAEASMTVTVPDARQVYPTP